MNYLFTGTSNNLSKAVNMAQKEPVFIKDKGKDVAVILSAKDYKRIAQSNIKALLTLCDSIGKKAKAKGLTQARLKKLLEES